MYNLQSTNCVANVRLAVSVAPVHVKVEIDSTNPTGMDNGVALVRCGCHFLFLHTVVRCSQLVLFFPVSLQRKKKKKKA